MSDYCTLAELKDRLFDYYSYTAPTISFDGTAKKIIDSAYGLKRFEDANNISALIRVESTTNSGIFRITSVEPGEIVVAESLTTAAAGNTTISVHLGNEHDAKLQSLITASSRLIDRYCGRRFFSSAATQYYDAQSTHEVFIDDLLSVTALETDDTGDGSYETLWAVKDYNLLPYNSTPKTRIQTSAQGSRIFPAKIKKCIQIAGSFGYCTTANQPPEIKEACILQVMRLFKRKDAPFGVSGINQFGVMQVVDSFDKDVKILLDGYRRVI
jgi:hypothetical protein